jgi:hypothetical protein
MKKLSPKMIVKIKQRLPELRQEAKKDFGKWEEYTEVSDFYSDEKVIRALPFAAHEYMLINRDLRVDKMLTIEWLNLGLFDDWLDKIVIHALRKVALRKKL